jgi:hypothetical protein
MPLTDMRVTVSHLMPYYNRLIVVTPVRTDSGKQLDLPSKLAPGETREFALPEGAHLVIQGAS